MRSGSSRRRIPCPAGSRAMSLRRRAGARSPCTERQAGGSFMFERLEPVVADAILGLMTAFRADTDARKVDLGVGVYRDDRGETPVLDSVRRAEELLLRS